MKKMEIVWLVDFVWVSFLFLDHFVVYTVLHCLCTVNITASTMQNECIFY